jgi:hypothetical protein
VADMVDTAKTAVADVGNTGAAADVGIR